MTLTLFIVAAFAACETSTESTASPTADAASTEAAATPTPSQNSSNGGSETENSSLTLDEALLERVKVALEAQDDVSFHFELIASLQASFSGIPVTVPVKLVGDFRPPGSSTAELSVSFGFVAFETQVVVVGNTIYSQDPTTQRWQKTESDTTILSGPMQAIVPVLAGAESLSLIAQETLNGTEVLHVRAENVSGVFGESGGDATIDVWLNASNLRIVRITLVGEVALTELGQQFEQIGSSGATQLEVEILVSDYGKEVVIVVPNVPAGLVRSCR
ncbi:MAG: LppX_LprAFG lipoprotein [Chloroflexi bacterium]|nr:LppX_LprAFG lipoprotein [Chloroflexota bacterium]